MNEYYELIEFPAYINLFLENCKTDKGKNFFISIKPYNRPEDINRFHSYILDFKDIKDRGLWEGFYITDIGDIVDKICYSMEILSVKEIYDLAVTVKELERIKQIFSETSFNHIIPDDSLTDETNEILSIIDKDMSIKSSASPQLKEIREKLNAVRNKIEGHTSNLVKKYAPFLQESIFTIRNGRYVLPVKSGFKSRVKGIIHDRSDSGNTLFIEPIEMVELVNEEKERLLEEEREIFRILSRKTGLIRDKKDILTKYWDFAVFIDILQSIVTVMDMYDAVLPEISKKFRIKIRKGYHPMIKILKKDEAVPYDFDWKDDIMCVVVSGPNTGGKTVFLKTVGLFVVVSNCGLPLFAAEGTVMPFVNNIFVDIGDKQSIEDSLSTFSAHLVNIKNIAEKGKKGDIVILDEPGGGTDPDEGASLGIGIIEYLVKKGIRVLSSSHFSRIKHYATEKDYAMNVSMGFDDETLKPTYKLQVNMPGLSLGISTAERYNLPHDIIKVAKEYMEPNVYAVNRMLESLNKKENDINDLKDKLEKEKEEIQRELYLIKEKEEKIKEKEKELKRIYRNRFEEELNRIRSEFEKVVKEIKKGNKEGISRFRDTLKKNPIAIEKEERFFNEGDTVVIEGTSQPGIIVKSLKGNMYKVSFNGIMQRIPGYKLKKIKDDKIKKSSRKTTNIPIEAETFELNIIGKRRDDGMWDVLRFLDELYYEGIRMGRIVHGKGSGILKSMVKEVLSKDKRIDVFGDAPPERGGGGVTEFYFKKEE